ncbi:mycothiol synthase [Saccharopolyspora lacisalsi]|uniref:Mycothiol acetyltransferase n=1 Tax=Halosaccharopolyspora lacisalsi TaxID=1000566 RepID=A0A839E313_9PSEU|nr:mycothiol synthase [Halosaccharopolyspora lacisalsi]MBA8827259.1 mycothiol synthase [Halosaccharopolyspora lacisalsi]
MVQLTWRNGLDGAETAEVMRLLSEAESADGVAPAGEHVILRLRAHRGVVEQIEPVQADVGGSEHFVVRDAEDELVGYAHLDTAGEPTGDPLVAELAVHPRHRGRGAGEKLVSALLERAEVPAEPGDADTGRLRIWSHGLHPAASRLAERFGFRRSRELWRMGRELDDTELGEAPLPEWVTIRAFRPGVDEAAVVRVNHRAFSWHPEQGGMDEAELRGKQREDWFDPAGFLLAVDSAGELLGFHWTKVHPDGTGEVYVIGVDPDTQGSGLGKSLTVAGMRHLRDVGCPRVMLYVEGDNAAAIGVYQRLEFRRWDIDVQFGR